MVLVSLKKFELHVCLADCCRISFLFLLGILWNFLEGAGSNYPKILSDEGPGSMVQLHSEFQRFPRVFPRVRTLINHHSEY